MRSALATVAQRSRGNRQRSTSLSTVPPARNSGDYLPELAAIAASIIYRSPLPSQSGLPVYIVNAAAFPDAFEVDYDSLLPYVLARLPGEDELLSGTEYEVIFFAGGQPEGATTEKKQGPGIGWYLQAYHALSRAMRKKLQKLYIVHPRTWVRVLVGVFGTVVSPKFRRKIEHVNTLSGLALQIPIEKLLIPPPVYLHDRRLMPEIDVPYASGRRAFGARHPLPRSLDTGKTRLPRVLRETTSFILMPRCVKMEGLFRIPPHSILAGVLKEAYDRGQKFIVWKEKGATYAPPGMQKELINEIKLEDAYGAYLAASLIKTWYRELREPIFPESSYEVLRSRYSSADDQATPEDLVDMLLPASTKSPLTVTSREILIRHLLPLLSEVAAHEPDNKMNAENLAICFAMALVCGSNQMEDAKMTMIIRRVLGTAIEMWPQLREGLGMSADDFKNDIDAPADSRDYEDPLIEQHGRTRSVEEAGEKDGAHRIELADADSPTDVPSPERERAPALPPRPSRSRAASDAAKNVFTAIKGHVPVPPLPKRKPAPQPQPSPSFEPPRYSAIFSSEDGDEAAHSPVSYTVSNGNTPMENYENEKKGFPASAPPMDPNPAIQMPKRKAVSTEHALPDTEPAGATSAPPPRTDSLRSPSETHSALIARAAAQKAASSRAPSINEPISAPGAMKSDSNTAPEPTFRKPSWPASRPPIQVPTLAKPILPSRQRSQETRPGTMVPSNDLQTPVFPKPRTPSPGLLKRMSTMENVNGGGGGLAVQQEPRKLNLKKASVDDLRRLYEERVEVAGGLKRVETGRRESGAA